MNINKSQAKPPYFNVMIAEENGTEATMLLYGYIGEEYSWDEDGWKRTGITDIEFVKEFNRLQSKFQVIHIRINSYGGEIYHGAAIVNAIQNATAEVQTWNDGLCASMAAGIWLAGKKRHMAKNAITMLHSASSICWGNAKDMRECAEALDKWDSALIAGIVAGTGKQEEEVKAYFDYSDHFMNYADCQEAGFITEEDAYDTASQLPTNYQTMTYNQLVKHFTDKKQEEGISLLDQIKQVFNNTFKAIASPSPKLSPTDILDMNFEDFKKSLQDGTLNADEVKAHLEEISKPDQAQQQQSAITALAQQIADLKNELTALGSAAGANKAAPAAPGVDSPTDTQETEAQRYARMNKELFEASNNNETLKVVMQ